MIPEEPESNRKPVKVDDDGHLYYEVVIDGFIDSKTGQYIKYDSTRTVRLYLN